LNKNMALADPVSVINELTDNVKNYGKLTMAIIKNITSLNSVEKNDFNEGLKRFKKFNNIAPNYLSLVNEILDSFTTKSNPNNDIKALLGYYERIESKNENGKVDTKTITGYAVIDTTNQISTLIKNITSSISTIADPKLFGFGSILRIKFNIRQMSKMLKALCNDIMGAFKGLNFKSRDLSILFGEPETIVQLNDINKAEKFETTVDNKDVTGTNGLRDTTRIITKRPKMGLIEGMMTIINLIKGVLDMDLGIFKMLKFRKNVRRMKKMWNTIIEEFFKGFSNKSIEEKNLLLTLLAGKDDKDDDCFIVKYNRFLESIISINGYLEEIGGEGLIFKKSKQQNQRIDGLFIIMGNILDKTHELSKKPLLNEYITKVNDFFTTFNKTIVNINNIWKLSPNKITLRLIKSGINNVFDIIKHLIDTFSTITVDFKLLTDNVKKISEVFTYLKHMFIDITLCGLLAIPIMIFMVPIMVALWGIKVMMRKLSKIEVPENINQQIESLKGVFDNLKQVFIDIILCGLLAVPAALAGVILAIVIWPIVGLINIIGKALNKLKMVTLQKDMSSLVMILGLMGAALLILAGLAVVTKLVVDAGLWIIGSFALMIGILLLMWGINKVMSGITWAKMSLEMISLLLILGLIVAAIGILYLLSLVTEKLEGKWKQLFIALGAISVVLVIIIGFSFLLGAIGGLMITSTIGFGVVLAIVVMITMIIASLNEIADAEIKKDQIHSKLKIIGGIIAGEGDEEKWTLKYFMDKIGKGWGKGKRRTKKIRKMVNNIKEIVDTLNEIGKYTLNTTNITNNLQTVYDAVTGTLAPEIVEGKETGNYKVSGLMGFIDTLNKSIEKQKVLRKANQSLRKLRRTTNIIKDICDNLNEIMKFNIETGAIGGQLENIFTVIGKVQEKINEMLKTDGQTQETMTRIQRREERKRMRHERKKMRIANQTLGKVDAVLEEVASIVDSVNSIKDFNVKTDDIEKKIENIFAVINTIQTQINEKLNIDTNPSVKIQYLAQLGDALSSFAFISEDTEGSEKVMGNIGTFIEKINTIDNTEIAKTRDIFKDMVQSVKDLNTNFEKLSKTMDKDIAKSLGKMNEQLEKSGGLFNNGVQTTSQTSTTSQTQSTNQSDMDNTLKAQLAQQLAYDSETLGYMEEIVRLLKTNKFRVITT
jgi:hypothetical protein